MVAERLKAFQVLLRNIGLLQKPVEFIQALKLFALFLWHSRAVFANAIAMPAPTEPLVGASTPTYATDVAHVG
jgi:hypothetical protein